MCTCEVREVSRDLSIITENNLWLPLMLVTTCLIFGGGEVVFWTNSGVGANGGVE